MIVQCVHRIQETEAQVDSVLIYYKDHQIGHRKHFPNGPNGFSPGRFQWEAFFMNKNPTFLDRYSLPLFLILTPLISLSIPLFLQLPVEIVPFLMAFIPALLAILISALTDGRRGVGALMKKLFQWRVSIKWYAIALVLAFGLRLAIAEVAVLLRWIPEIRMTPWAPVEFIIIGVFILIGAVFEELAWRGYVLPKLLANHSAIFSGLLIGVIWGVIHLGLILPGQMNAGSNWLLTILYIVGLSVILTWLYVQTQGNLVIPILYHFGQSYFVFLNGGISSTQQLGLMTAITAVISLVLVLFYGMIMQRPHIKKPIEALE
jgi:uncharacterized protein